MIQLSGLYSYRLLMRGASRGVLEVGQARRPRACLRKARTRAARGLRPGTLAIPCQELADG